MSRPKRTYQLDPTRPLSERDWQRIVSHWAREFGWLEYHTLNSWGSRPGVPDLVLVRPPRLMFVELKSDKGKLKPQQEEWLENIRACGVEAWVWRPSDERVVLGQLA